MTICFIDVLSGQKGDRTGCPVRTRQTEKTFSYYRFHINYYCFSNYPYFCIFKSNKKLRLIAVIPTAESGQMQLGLGYYHLLKVRLKLQENDPLNGPLLSCSSSAFYICERLVDISKSNMKSDPGFSNKICINHYFDMYLYICIYERTRLTLNDVHNRG